MAGVGAENSGLKVPLNDYSSSVINQFPRPHRLRQVESSIARTQSFDTLPVNLPLSQKLKDNFLEFRIPGVPGAFLDLGKIVIEFRVTLTEADGQSPLGETSNIALINGFSNTLFKSVQCFLGEQITETNSSFNYWSFIKLCSSVKRSQLPSIARLGYLLPDFKGGEGITKLFDTAYFARTSAKEPQILTKNDKEQGITLCFPLALDISTLDQYLLDNIDLKIRLELSPQAWTLKTDDDASTYQLHINYAKLWLNRVYPYTSAYMALNKSLALDAKPIIYTFNRTLSKNYVLGHNQTSLLIDQPWGHVIPAKIFMVILPMTAYAGKHKENGLYFEHGDLASLSVCINNNTVYRISSDFPHHYSKLYYEAINSLGIEEENLILYESFASGRTINIFNLTDSQVEDALPIEKSGNLRIELQFSKPAPHNKVVLLFAQTTGVLSIDQNRSVHCDVRA
ncbi:uncharacterized protein [Cherax quadricarinatus]|uniref:uncharacterized protein n=1 Tax=Cherax quadricarinatus TaxID=27406 RepID=UPI00387E3F73